MSSTAIARDDTVSPAPESCRGGADPRLTKEFFDRQEIFELVRLERFWRDQCQWDKLAASYVPESQVCTTWFLGTGAEFAAASKVMFEDRGSRGKHMIWPAWARIKGDRAICESPGTIYARSLFDGIEIDMMNYARFHSLIVRTPRGWRMKSFMGIYMKDTMIAVNPTEKLPVDWNEIRKFRPAYRFLCYTMMRRGYSVSQELPGDDRPDITAAYYAKADRWLETGEAFF
jgi:hypothetical protein